MRVGTISLVTINSRLYRVAANSRIAVNSATTGSLGVYVRSHATPWLSTTRCEMLFYFLVKKRNVYVFLTTRIMQVMIARSYYVISTSCT